MKPCRILPLSLDSLSILALAVTLCSAVNSTVADPLSSKGQPWAAGVSGAELGIFERLEVPPGEAREIFFWSGEQPSGLDPVLTIVGRLEFNQAGGRTYALRLSLNGKRLTINRLLNKAPMEERADGSISPSAASGGDVFTVDYAPDFISTDTHPTYALKRRDTSSSDFVFSASGVLTDGTNSLVIENRIQRPLTNTLILEAGALSFRPPTPTSLRVGPPSGPLPTFCPNITGSSEFDVRLEQDNSIRIEFKGRTLQASSDFSTPDPAWRTGSNSYFEFERSIEKTGQAVLVRDRFTNLSESNLPLMRRHRVETSPEKIWLAGLSPAGLKGSASVPANPTAFVACDDYGIGLLPLDDVFQVHVASFADATGVGIADYQLVLPPRATHISEWAILPTDKPDYFEFVNAVRRLRDVNFTIEGSFAFLRADPNITGTWSDQELIDFTQFKDAHFLCTSLDSPRYKGVYPHGTAFQSIDHTYRGEHIARLRRLVPDARHLVYFHCFIDVLDEAPTRYADARLLRGDGSQAIYGEPHDRIFLPTSDNSFGRDVARNVDLIFDSIGADGVYWDEMEYSSQQYHYGEPWDGVSAEIDPTTMKVVRLKSSVTLLSQPYRLELARRILARGPLIANGSPHTRTMAQIHIPRFVETGSISNCAQAQLFTPIALGDHLTEANETDAYRVALQALNYGCVYYWYNDTTVIPSHPHLTRYMFPITPIELGEGFIIGRERILTNRSGIFGWEDSSEHEIHLFDEEGREVSKAAPPTVAGTYNKDGKTWTELRLGEGWSAAVVRTGQGSRSD